jgi:Lon protease-like protein
LPTLLNEGHNRTMLSELLPLFPLQLVLLPGASLPLHIFEPRYREMIGAAAESGAEFGVLFVRDGMAEDVGCTAVIEAVTHRHEDGRFDVTARGLRRFRTLELDHGKAYLRARVEFFDDEPHPPPAPGEIEELYELTVRAAALTSTNLDATLDLLDPQPSFRAAGVLPLDPSFRQQLLESRSERERSAELRRYLDVWIKQTEVHRAAKTVAGTNGHARPT